MKSSSGSSGIGGNSGRTFDKAREHSIEVYDDNFQRNSILTRSARIRKFKFYQYKPIPETSPSTPLTTNKLGANSEQQQQQRGTNNQPTKRSFTTTTFDDDDDDDILLPRANIVQGKVGLSTSIQQSKELSELDDEIVQLEKKIADLNGDSNKRGHNLDEIFDLVNKKNDLLRRQMQLNILEQEKALEKANEELTKELRSLMSIEDSRKSKAELERQQYLYDQSLALVNKRNELVHHMDDQERGIEDDNALKATLKTVISKSSMRKIRNSSGAGGNGSQDQNCCIQ